MNHGVAVGANRDKVFDRVHHIALTDIAQRQNMMNVDEPLSNLTVLRPEIESAYTANRAMMPYAFVSGVSIPLVAVY